MRIDFAFKAISRARRFLLVYIARAVTLAAITQVIVAPMAAASLSQGYKSNETLVAGTLVSLDTQNAGTVVPANAQNSERLLGVVVSTTDSLLSLSSGGTTETQVATTGIASTLVSDINGDIKVGDSITISPISGVGMKATISAKSVGVAQADFSASSQGVTKRDVTDKSGKAKSVAIGQIPINVQVASFVSASGDQSPLIPPFLQNLANLVAGKKVSAIRILIATILLLMAVMVVTILVYGAVRSSIISIGRNPLSAASVRKSLVQVLLVAVAILGVAMGAVYIIISR